MVQAREQPRFALEAGARVAVRPDVRRQDLDRDRAIEAGVACAVDFAHAPRADGRLDDVGTEAGSGGEGHRERNYRRRPFEGWHLGGTRCGSTWQRAFELTTTVAPDAESLSLRYTVSHSVSAFA